MGHHVVAAHSAHFIKRSLEGPRKGRIQENLHLFLRAHKVGFPRHLYQEGSLLERQVLARKSKRQCFTENSSQSVLNSMALPQTPEGGRAVHHHPQREGSRPHHSRPGFSRSIGNRPTINTKGKVQTGMPLLAAGSDAVFGGGTCGGGAERKTTLKTVRRECAK